MTLHKPRMTLMDLVILIAIQAMILAGFSHKTSAMIAFSCLWYYVALLSAFFGPISKLDRYLYIVIPGIVVALALPVFVG